MGKPVVEVEPVAKEDPEPVAVEPAVAQPVAAGGYQQLAPGVSMVELETLKAQVKDWKEKYETIRMKRQEDRSKLKEVEKMRIQIQQLSDGKSRSSQQVQELSKQLREAKAVSCKIFVSDIKLDN